MTRDTIVSRTAVRLIVAVLTFFFSILSQMECIYELNTLKLDKNHKYTSLCEQRNTYREIFSKSD